MKVITIGLILLALAFAGLVIHCFHDIWEELRHE